MLLFLKTVRGERKFCQQLALESTKFIKARLFQELDTLSSYQVHFGTIKGLVTSICQATKLVQSLWIFIMAESARAYPFTCKSVK